ncbi:DnaJ domain-containing protein [Chroococcidiopsis sp. CCMEE 29]|uniref:J domain-containing protein n=1 Tax=Chroococcidiopsis sp. CCMEE 29 TaxID=155894 RepID=UPI0020200CF1|nr:DnaJ domain-containing protein [Chroococcidiopsis sp. CCMEE 29]
MELADCYQLLGLKSGASVDEVKAAYRYLARQYHPDFNPDDRQAREKFIALTEAYKLLISLVQPAQNEEPSKQQVSSRQPLTIKVKPKEKPTPNSPLLSESEKQLKRSSYLELQQLLKYKRFPKAIALIEGLAKRLPQDREVRQWQAIAYQRWGSYLITEKQLDKARIYLKKALKTDPHNKSLWTAVERDFRRMEKIY